jgi:N-acetylglutamate synthase-like GNAT family acetyltransferase
LKDINSPKIFIRKAKITDSIFIEEILRETSWFEHITEKTIQNNILKIKNHLIFCEKDSCHNIYIAEKGNEVVGYVSVHWMFYAILSGPEGYISELFVSEAERGHGIGNFLLEEVKKQAKMRGCSRLMLVNNRNRLSYEKEFYKKNGFIEREHIANFIFPLP